MQQIVEKLFLLPPLFLSFSHRILLNQLPRTKSQLLMGNPDVNMKANISESIRSLVLLKIMPSVADLVRFGVLRGPVKFRNQVTASEQAIRSTNSRAKSNYQRS